MLLRVRISPCQQQTVIGIHRVGRPDLLAVDHVMVVIAHRPRAQRCKIRSGIRLRKTLAPDFAVRHACQITALLRFGAVRQQRAGCVVEISGGITIENARSYAEAGADFLSSGALTHSAPAANLSLLVDSIEET